MQTSLLLKRQLAKKLCLNGKWQKAQRILLDILEQFPNDYEILSQLGYVAHQMKSFKEALYYYQKCINLDTDNNWYFYHEYAKILHFNINDLDNAKLCYNKSMKMNDGNTSIYYHIAKLHYDLSEFQESCTFFEKYLSLCSNDYIARYEYSKLLFYKFDKKNDAKLHIKQSIDNDPTNTIFLLEFAIMLKQCNAIKKAKKNYLKCLQITQEKDPKYLYEYGLFLTDSLKDTNNGMLYFQKAMDLDPSNEHYKNEYIALKKWNDYQSAQKELKEKKEQEEQQRTNHQSHGQSLNSNSNSNNHSNKKLQKTSYLYHAKFVKPKPAHNNKSNKHSEREIYNSIKRDTRRIAFDDNGYGNNNNNNHYYGHHNHHNNIVDWERICGANQKYKARIIEFKSKFKIACQAQAEHNYILAKSILEDLIKIAPEDGEIFGRYAFALAQLNYLQEAEKYYKKSLQLSARNYVTMYNYAFLLYYKLGRCKEAEALYLKCLKIKPNCAKALLNYARLLDTIKKHTLSEEYYRMCLSGSPNYDLCFYYFGCFLYRQERYDEAKYYLQKAVDCWPHSHLHHFRLAVTCHVLCEYDKCAYHLKEALKIKPNFDAAMQAFERYGYGKITKGYHGELSFENYHYDNNSMNNSYNNNNGHFHRHHHHHHHHHSYENNNYNNHYKGNNHRNGKYYVKKNNHELDEKQKEPESSSSPKEAAKAEREEDQKPLRMYDPVRRNLKFKMDEKWSDENNDVNKGQHSSDLSDSNDKKYFVNWLKTSRLYEEFYPVFVENGIKTMKQFHSKVNSKEELRKLVSNTKDQDDPIDVLWDSAPKLSQCTDKRWRS